MEPSVASSTSSLDQCLDVNQVSVGNPSVLYPATAVRSPLSAYEWFVQLTKKDHFRRNPQLHRTPQTEESVETECHERWPNMSPTARKQFTNLESVDISRYNFQIRKAIAVADSEKSKREKKKKKRKLMKRERPVGKPVRPKGAFFHYHSSERHSMEKRGMSSREVMSQLAKQWRELSTEDRRPFEQRYEEERSIFESQLLEWRLSGAALGYGTRDGVPGEKTTQDLPEVIDPFDEENSETDNRASGSKVPPKLDECSVVPGSPNYNDVPSNVVGSKIFSNGKGKRRRRRKLTYRTAYQLYMKDMMGNLSKSRVNEKIELTSWKLMFREISLKWKNLPTSEREKYSRLAAETRKTCQDEGVVSPAASSLSKEDSAGTDPSSIPPATSKEGNLFDRALLPKASFDQPENSFYEESVASLPVESEIIGADIKPKECIVLSSSSSTTTASSITEHEERDPPGFSPRGSFRPADQNSNVSIIKPIIETAIGPLPSTPSTSFLPTSLSLEPLSIKKLEMSPDKEHGLSPLKLSPFKISPVKEQVLSPLKLSPFKMSPIEKRDVSPVKEFYLTHKGVDWSSIIQRESPIQKRGRPRTGPRGGSAKQVAFSLWYQENKERIRREFFPTNKTVKGDLMKTSRSMFKALSDAERSIFFRRARDKVNERPPKSGNVGREPELAGSSSAKSAKVAQMDFQDCIEETDILLGVRKTLTEDLEELEVGEASESNSGDGSGNVTGYSVERDCGDDIAESDFVKEDCVNYGSKSHMMEEEVAETSIIGEYAEDFEESNLTTEELFGEATIMDVTEEIAEDDDAETSPFRDEEEYAIKEFSISEEHAFEQDYGAETSILEEDNAGDYIFESSFDSQSGELA